MEGMVPIVTLWLPVLASAVLVFVASSVIHMALPWHKKDYTALAKEGEVLAALRKFDIPPGDYFAPLCTSMAEMKSPAFVEKMKAGPVAHMTFLPAGPPSMTKSLIQWFVYSLFVSLFAAYIAGRALHAGAPYLAVFRFSGATAFGAYSVALVQGSIWYGRSWTTTWKSVIDGFVYACLTAAVFGWLWPS